MSWEPYLSDEVVEDLREDRFSRAVPGVDGVRLVGRLAHEPRHAGVVEPAALAFVAAVCREARDGLGLAGLLAHRRMKQRCIDRRAEELAAAAGEGEGAELRDVPLEDGGVALGERPDLAGVRGDPSWRVRPLPARFDRFHDTIGGPPTEEFLASALGCGASFCMVDFEDCSTVRSDSMLEGMRAVALANRRRLPGAPAAGPGGADLAELLVRVEGLHLPQAHVLVDGRPAPAHLVTVCLYLWHNWEPLLARGSVPAFYLPKLERYEEGVYYAGLFRAAERALLAREPRARAAGYREGALLAMVIVENVHAAYAAEELLYALRDYAGGLNTGWHDYVASVGAVHARLPAFNMPPKSNLAIVREHLLAYQVALVRACLRRGAVPVGGMNGMVPTDACRDKVAAAFEADFRAQTARGLRGVWMGHPGNAGVMRRLVAAWRPVPDADVEALHARHCTHANLLVTRCPAAPPTLAEVERLMSDALQYLASYVSGSGCAWLTARMACGTPVRLTEDAATLERSRREVWALAAHGKVVRGLLGAGRDGRLSRESGRVVFSRVAARVRRAPPDVPHDARTKISYDIAQAACERLFFDERPAEYFTQLVLGNCVEPFLDHPALLARSALRARHPFLRLRNVAPECEVVFVTNQAFAPASSLLKAMDEPGSFPSFRPHQFGPQGQVYDGWETARHNIAPPDAVVLRPLRPCRVRGVNVDTAHFDGNHAVAASVQGLVVRQPDYQRQRAEWVDLVPRRATRGNSRHYWASECDEPVHLLRLTNWPDGGIARLEVFAEYVTTAERDAVLRWPRPVRPYVSDATRRWIEREVPRATGFPPGFVPNPVVEIDDGAGAPVAAGDVAGAATDLACLENGGRVIASSSSHYSRPENIIQRRVGVNMGDGWETIRMRPSSDEQLASLVGPVPLYNWTVVRLAAEARLVRCTIDTRHNRNNAPVCFSLEAVRAPGMTGADYYEARHRWERVVEPTPLMPHSQLDVEVSPPRGRDATYTHVLLKIYPCGGISRIRVFGEPVGARASL